MIDIRKLPNLTTQQKNFVAEFYRQFDFAAAGSGLNRHFANVEPLLYEGVIAASEFTVYAATKLYLCFDLIIAFNDVADVNIGILYLSDENNAVHLHSQNNSITYDPVGIAINYAKNNIHVKNFYFSRTLLNVYTYMKFIGYRITLD